MKRKKNGRFEKGNEGGPGRPELPPELKELKKLNQFELERVLNECLLLTPQQLRRIKDDPEATMLELLVVSIITHGTNKGDHQRLGFLLDRLIGKMKETVEVNMRPYKEMTDDELEREIAEAERRNTLPSSPPELLPSKLPLR